jgi:predicted AlkP superfamily phosphohydrolase/phosphomutase
MKRLVIGIDAAEPALVQRLIDAGRLPVLARLLADGVWRRVRSPADIGSGCVWPTFMTGKPPSAHGVYAEWAWRPDAMAVERRGGGSIVPFWHAWAERGESVGVFDVPFAPTANVGGGFEVREWGPHDAVDGTMSARPAGVAEWLAGVEAHPLAGPSIDPAGPEDRETVLTLAAACARGARQRGEVASALLARTRPDVAVVVFPEVHHAAHYTWHGIEPEAAVYARQGVERDTSAGEALVAVLVEVDRQVGGLVDAAGGDVPVMVFSLHGMRAATGIAGFLTPLLVEAGLASVSGWRRQSWRERAVSMFAGLKRRSPAALKRLYYRSISTATTRRWARTTMLPAYDWSATRAFSLPTDQHGWVRVNLRGREARGIVDAGDYQPTLDEIEELMRSLVDVDGRQLVIGVRRTAVDWAAAVRSELPDLVVHWGDAALASPVAIRGFRTTGRTIGRKFTGQHAFEGFCLWRGPRGPALEPSMMDASGLAAVIDPA